MDPSRLASTLVDNALTSAMMPWPCPSDFGPGGRFRLEELISMGPRSLVYKGVDKKLSSEGFAATVAIKIASSVRGGEVDALAARRVVHPNVVRVLDLGTDPQSGAEFVVTEFIEGGDMQSLTVPVPMKHAARLVSQLARGVQAAHSAGVVHCDLKPANVLLTPDGTPKLADFDLSRSPVSPEDTVRGNLAFMAPEQAKGGENSLAPVADIYALGGMLRWLLTGATHRREASGLGEMDSELAAMTDLDLARICQRAMSREPGARHASAGELAHDLDRWLTKRPVEWTRPSPLRRSWLWLQRNPGAAALIAFGVLLVVGAAYVRERQRIFELQEVEKSKNAAVRLADEKVERIKASARGTLKTIIVGSGIVNGEPADVMFPQIVMWSMLVNGGLVDEQIKPLIKTNRRSAVEGYLQNSEQLGRSENTNVMLARFAFAQLLLEGGEDAAASAQLKLARAWWAPRLPADDPLMINMRVLEATIAYDQQAATEGENGPSLAALHRALEEATDQDAGEGASNLARMVIRRHAAWARGDASPTNAAKAASGK